MRRQCRFLILSLVCMVCLSVAGSVSAAAPGPGGKVQERVFQRLQDQGRARVLIRVRENGDARPGADTARRTENRLSWIDRRERLMTRLSRRAEGRVRSFRRMPFLAMEVDQAGLQDLVDSEDVAAIYEDKLHEPVLSSSGPVIGSDIAHANGYTGSGALVAVLDTGVHVGHELFAGKTVVEACFSTNYAPHGAVSLCPNGGEVQYGPGAARPCSLGGCDHGTHVAGIAVGDGRATGEPSGVAPDAGLVAIQVFSEFNGSDVLTYTSDFVAAMEYVLDLKVLHGYNIASVNLSVGGDPACTAYECDFYQSGVSAEKYAVDLLKNAGIATVAAAGNSGNANGISSPGCVSGAVGVGASTDSDTVASYSNRGSWLTMFAPGSSIRSSTSAPAGYGYKSGTSMATPQVAGALAVLKSAAGDAALSSANDVDRLVATLIQDSPEIFDSATGRHYPRFQLDDALSYVESGALAVDLILDSD